MTEGGWTTEWGQTEAGNVLSGSAAGGLNPGRTRAARK